MEERTDSFDNVESFSLGGVLPRFAIGAFSGVSGPFIEPLVSEVDRSWGAGLRENSRRKEAPIEEARWGRVSSFFFWGKTISNLGSRTIPGWNGTADNLSIWSSRQLCKGLSGLGIS